MMRLPRRRSASAARRVILLYFVLFGIISCTPQADVEPLRAPTVAGSLQPYQTPSPSPMPPSATPVPTQTPLPTATPHIYIVKSGDTLGSIALAFGLDMGDLVNANPDVSPYAMSVGQEVVIPDGEASPVSLPTLAPLALELSAPDCYPTPSGGLWCFVLVQNSENLAVENISVNLSLYDEEGDLISRDVAYPLQDRLPAGEALAALVYFAHVPPDSHPTAALLTAFTITDDDARYLPGSLQGVFTQIAWDGKTAQLSGEVLVDGDADEVWVMATAFDAAGHVVGVRRWESTGGKSNFDLTVASLMSTIDSVNLSVEAHRLTVQE